MRVGSGGHAKVLISISHGKKDIVSMNRGVGEGRYTWLHRRYHFRYIYIQFIYRYLFGFDY